MDIKNVNTIEELDAILGLCRKVFKIPHQAEESDEKYSRKFWIRKFNEQPELLLYGEMNDMIIGSVFGWNDNNAITIGHCFVNEEFRGKRLGKALMLGMEKRVGALGYHKIALGSVGEAEGFYAKLGYKGMLLIQSGKDSVEDLQSLNDCFEEIGTNVYEGHINQVFLRVPLGEKDIQKKYKERFPYCNTQMVFFKKV